MRVFAPLHKQEEHHLTKCEGLQYNQASRGPYFLFHEKHRDIFRRYRSYEILFQY